ncbi:MAG: mechanosensitive ion channel domain-containing protein [Verrucomicrobiota bacterium]
MNSDFLKIVPLFPFKSAAQAALVCLFFIFTTKLEAQIDPAALLSSESESSETAYDPALVPETVDAIEEKRAAFRVAYTFPPEATGEEPLSLRVSRLIYELDATYENQITAFIQLQETREELNHIGEPDTWTQVTAVGDLSESLQFAQIEQLFAVENQLSRNEVLGLQEVTRADDNLTVARNAYQAIQTKVTQELRGGTLQLEEKNEELSLWLDVEQYVLRRIQSRLARARKDLVDEKLALFEPFLDLCQERLVITEEEYDKRISLFTQEESKLDQEMMVAQRQLTKAESDWEELNASLTADPTPAEAAQLVAMDYQRQAKLAQVSLLQRSLNYLSIRRENIKRVFRFYEQELTHGEVLSLKESITKSIRRLSSEVEFMTNELEQARESLDSRQRQLSINDTARLVHFQQAHEAAKSLVQSKQEEVALINRMLADAENFQRQLNKETQTLDPKMIASRVRFSMEQFWNFEFFRLDDNPFTVATLVWITLSLIATLLLAWLVAWALTFLLQNRLKLDHRVATASRKLFFYLNMVIGVVIVFWIFDFPLSSLAIPTSILALALGFASQEILKNFMSGVILLIERPIAPGDIIEMSERILTVESIGARSTRLRDFDATEKIVPNSTLLENVIINRTLTDRTIRTTIDVGIAYGSPTREAEKILLDAASNVEGVYSNPAPFVIFDHFGDNALGFRLYFWCSADHRMTISSELRHVIDEMLKQANIVIAFPQRDIHLDSSSPLQIEWSNRPDEPSQPAGQQSI